MTETTEHTPATGTDRSPASLRGLLGVVMLGALMMQLDLTMTNIATETLVRELHSTLNTIQWVGTGYLLAMAAMIPLAGWALERFGARTVWTTCSRYTVRPAPSGAHGCGLGGRQRFQAWAEGCRGSRIVAVPASRSMPQLGGAPLSSSSRRTSSMRRCSNCARLPP